MHLAKGAFAARPKSRDYLTHPNEEQKIVLHLRYVELVAFAAKSTIIIEEPTDTTEKRAVVGVKPKIIVDLTSSVK